MYGSIDATETLDVDYDISVRIDEAHENSTSFKKMSIP